MKTLFLSVIAWGLLSCQPKTEVSDSNPSLAKINGQWQLTKISMGYPMPDSPSSINATNIDIISFDASKKTYTRTVDGKVTENSNFDIQKISLNGSQEREAIIFEKEKQYAFLTYDDANSSITLYEKSPIGAELADGNSYHYQKVK